MVSTSLLLKLEAISAKIFLKMIFNRLKSRKIAKFMISFIPVLFHFLMPLNVLHIKHEKVLQFAPSLIVPLRP